MAIQELTKSEFLKELVSDIQNNYGSARQKSKGVTFGLSYGAFPKKVAATLKIPIEEAQQIFDRYHNELYAGITEYRENYVLPTTLKQGRIHLGLGCYIKSDDPNRDIRTLNNATCQFWSIVTALTINKIHQLIDDNGLSADIICTSTIYDSIYFIVRKDAQIIKWLNDTIVPIMTADFIEGQIIHNEAEGELGLSWADLVGLPNNASIDDIQRRIDFFDFFKSQDKEFIDYSKDELKAIKSKFGV